MPDLMRLSTPDGELVYELPADAVCAYFLGCRKPAVQMRRLRVLDPVPVCADHTEHADRFRPPAVGREVFTVPSVGPVTVVLGELVSPNVRAYRVLVAGVIVVEDVSFYCANLDNPKVPLAALRKAATNIRYAAEPWVTAAREFAGREFAPRVD